MKFQIKTRFSSATLFECELSAEYDSRPQREQLGAAVREAYLGGADLGRADLRGADLREAYLREAYLRGADLGGAYLREAYLGGADLGRADLRGADLREAYLREAYLGGADLGGAYLREAYLGGADLGGAYLGENKTKKLVGNRPFFQIGPLGSRADYLLAFLTDDGVYVRAGCFFDTLDTFKAAVVKEHGESAHAHEYAAATAMIEAHFAAWPAT